MKAGFALTLGLMVAALTVHPQAECLGAEEEGFKSIFDGKTLEGWDGNPELWRVEDNAITGETTQENPTRGNTFIIWRGGEPGDFELKLEYRIHGHNSGIQYRSFEVKDSKWVVGGYQADLEAGDLWSGALYGEKFRGTLARRGQKTVIGDNHKPKVVGQVGDTKELQTCIKKEDWNEYHIVARGFHFIQMINGKVMSEVTDEDKAVRRASGILALQLHAGPPMKVQFRNIRLKTLKAEAACDTKGKKKICFVAGRPSHGRGAHEHNAGCLLLARLLNENMPGISAVVHKSGWPEGDSFFDGADAIVMFCDGGGRHMVMPNLDQVDRLAKKGVGIACIHYGVEVPKGEAGNLFLDWTGGYFEAHWSVNPHWVAEFKSFPEHPITRGLKPFTMNDEWYFHMRFRPNMEGVTPVLSAHPPDSTMKRSDGAHSGNPHVREALKKGEIQHLGWARERPDGGRGFGFTGAHWHKNWKDDDFRKIVLNAIAWIAKVEVPADGVPSKTPTDAEIEADQD